ncbi:MAG: hypothetical protein ACRC8Z_03640 [Empedobacter falsenii]
MLEILKNKENLVFVGSFALVQHGLKSSYTDYDVVVTDLEGLPNAIEYNTDSKFSNSGERAYIISNPKVDIFIENELPEFEIINGFRVQTIESMRYYYYVLRRKVDDHWKREINEILKLLK